MRVARVSARLAGGVCTLASTGHALLPRCPACQCLLRPSFAPRSVAPLQLLCPRLPGRRRAMLPWRLQQDGPAGRHQVQGKAGRLVFKLFQFLTAVPIHQQQWGAGCLRSTPPGAAYQLLMPHTCIPFAPYAGQVGRRLPDQCTRGGVCVHGLHGQPDRG